jgi:hypothetical protein
MIVIIVIVMGLGGKPGLFTPVTDADADTV